MRMRIGVIVALLTLAVTGCNAGAGPGGSVNLDEKDKGRTVPVAVGSHITVVLHSTYWHFDPLPGSGVLTMSGSPQVAASPPGQGCVPGGGCGTVTADYTAATDGTVTVSAARTSCGEARGCSRDEATFAVTIAVGATNPTSQAAQASPAAPTTSSTIVATDTDNGHTITLTTGDHLLVQLASTYWQFSPPTGGALRSDGEPSLAASPPGVGCVPGGGCGLVTAGYVALAPGSATVSANRTSCGEARLCTPGQGHYELTVVVR